MIRITSSIDEVGVESWNAFNLNHPDGNFYQSSHYYFALTNETNYTPLVYFAIDNESLVGLVLVVIQKETLGPLSFLSARAIIQGGPLVKDNNSQIVEGLLSELNKAIKNRAIYTQFRNSFDTSVFSQIFKSKGYYFEEHLNILIDLTKPEDQLWKDLHTKRRNEVRKAGKEGTVFDVSADPDIIEKTYEILSEVYKRAKLPLPSVDFFHSLYQNLGPDIFRVFVAKNNDTIIGAMYSFCYNDTIIDWYAGAFKEYYKKYPNDLIPWEVFLWGKKNGFKKFDFGGAGKPNVEYGVRDYKKKFGGEFVNYGRYECINRPIIFGISKTAFKIIRYVLFK